MICFFHTIEKRQAMVFLFLQSLLLILCLSESAHGDKNKQSRVFFAPDNTKMEEVVYSVNHSGSVLSFKSGLERVIPLLEKQKGKTITPENFPRICILLDFKCAPGLAPSKSMVDALVAFLLRRGFGVNALSLVYFSDQIEVGNFLTGKKSYQSFKIINSERGDYFDRDWWHESSLPSTDHDRARLYLDYPDQPDKRQELERKSYLPACLFTEDTYWINVAVAMDDLMLGIDGAVGSLTLGASSNTDRFLKEKTIANAAASEILAIPEFWEKRIFSILDMSRFQFAGGGSFDAEFIASSDTFLIGVNPLSVDYHGVCHIAKQRAKKGFLHRPMNKISLFEFGRQLGLGDASASRLIQVTNRD